MRQIFILLFFCFSFGVNAQIDFQNYGDYTYVYEISKEVAYDFHEYGLQLEEKHFENLIDSVRSRYYYPSNILGHYLLVKVKEEGLSVTLKSRTSFTAITVNNKRDLALQVFDSLGQTIETAKIDLDGKQILFDHTTKTYRLKKWNKGGTLQIRVNNEMMLYSVNREYNSSILKRKWQNFKVTPLGNRVVVMPYRVISRPYHYLKRGLINDNWRMNWMNLVPFKKLYARIFEKDDDYIGYITTNKPRYLPSDTVKVKAYVTKPNGKPIKGELDFIFTENRQSYKRFIDTLIASNTAGNYTHEFILGDSLTLDKHYSVSFSKRGKGRGLTRSFKYEDYQLDDVTWRFSSQKKIFKVGDPVVFTAEGKNASGSTVPDGEVEMLLITEKIKNFYGDEVYVKDTLWQHIQALRTRGETMVIVPDSIFPPINASFNVIAKFQNSNGELQEKKLKIDVSRKRDYLELSVKNGYFYADYKVNGQSTPYSNASLKLSRSMANVLVKDTVNLPFRMKLNHSMINYEVRLNNKFYRYLNVSRSNEVKDGVEVNGAYLKDSIFIRFDNPNLADVQYWIYKKKQLVAEGVTSESTFFWSKKDMIPKNYQIRYAYLWGGYAKLKEQTIQHFKNKLTIGVEQTQKVNPGEKVSVKIKVTKNKGKKAKKVNLTAGALNSKFKEDKNYDPPSIAYKKAKQLFIYNKFSLKPKSSTSTQLPLTKDLYHRYGLDSLFYYQMRFENNGLTLRYDTITTEGTYQDVAQFAPYVVKKGISQPIYMIYVNRRLVYYHDVDIKPMYSFIGRSGKNSITIRTKDAEYRLVAELKNGYKLELILDEDNYSSVAKKYSIRKTAKPKLLTPLEISLLRKSIFILKPNNRSNNNKYIWQRDRIHYLGKYHNNATLKLGPFTPGVPLKYLEQNEFMHTFDYEWGYTYQITAQKEKLIKYDFLSDTRKYSLDNKVDNQILGRIDYGSSNLITKEAKTPEVSYIKNRHSNSTERGSLRLERPRRGKLRAIVLENKSDTIKYIYPPRTTTFKHLKEGIWEVHIFANSGDYIQLTKEIKRNELLYINTRKLDFTPDSTKIVLNELIPESTAKLEEVLSLDEFNFLKKRKTGIIGKISYERDSVNLGGIKIKISTSGVSVAEASTDLNGHYHIELLEGMYDIEIDGGVNRRKLIRGFYVRGESASILDFILTKPKEVDLPESINLSEAIIIGYRVPLIKQNNTSVGSLPYIRQDEMSTGSSLTSEMISKIPSRSINGIVATSAGVTDYNVSIRGSRVNAQDYYVDGIRVSADLLPPLGNSAGVLDEVVIAGYGTGAPRVENNDAELSLVVNNDNASLPEGVQLRSNFQDYAYWQPNLVTDKNGEAYFEVTYPDNITSWNSYVIGMDHKKRAGIATQNVKAYKDLTAQLAIPRFLIAGDETDIIGKVTNFTSKTYDIESTFLLNRDEVLLNNASKIKEGLIERASVEAPFNQDSLTMTYQIRAGAYGDGEERSIPIYPQGVEENLGGFYILEGDTTLTVPVNEAYGATNIYIQDNTLKVLLREARYLRTYEYGCNEQTASRLIGLLFQKKVQEKLKGTFDAKGELSIRQCIARLKKTQNEDGSWGWWYRNNVNYWMTTHVVRALYEANKAGYTTSPLDGGLQFITNNLFLLEGNTQIKSLELLSDIGQNMDYEPFLAKLDILELNQHQRFITYKIRQANELPYSLDSLTQSRKESIFGSYYWGEDHYNWGNNRTQNTLLAYEIYKKAGDDATAKKILQYLLEARSTRSATGCRIGRNTYEISKALNVLLPDLLADVDSYAGLKTNITLESGFRDTIARFPYESSFTSTKDLTVTKQGAGAVYLTTYQTFHNPTPKAKGDLFEVRSTLLQKGKETKDLQQGEKATLKVTVEVKKSADYIMIEIPIPAGCSYYSKPQKWGYPTVHKEYFKEKTAIFCQSLDVGTYTYEVELEPRYNGTYTLNPTKVEQMYFPVFYGRNEIKRVEIGE